MESETRSNVQLDWIAGAKQIDDCEYLLVDEIREIEELTLEVTITEAKPQAEIMVASGEDPLEQLRMGGRPIERDGTCRAFRLVFHRKDMVLYAVLNESYGRYPELPERFTGKLFRVFSWSHLLEFTKRITNASDEYPGVLGHYQIACLNHVIDVICTAPPTISVRRGWLVGEQSLQ